MITKTVRSRFNHEVGEMVEGCPILERKVIIPPDPSQNRRGVYDYVVEVPPSAAKPAQENPVRSKGSAKASSSSSNSAPERGSYTRATPGEMAGVIRRVPGR
jgi:hypothetical protein